MCKKLNAVIFMILILTLTSCCFSQDSYSYIDLINRLTDMQHIATLPQKGELCKQWSSYDRRSYYDEKTGKYMNWDFNDDGFGGRGWIRKENGKLVLAEIEGPGCIWRTWSATPQKGHVRIYLDGNKEPAVDLAFEDYFSGKYPPFNRPSLVNIVGSGKNNYTPIPFQKSCKIIADKDYGEFHHFTYTIFRKGTKVPTFKMQLSNEENCALDKADEILSDCKPDMFNYPGQKTEKITVKIKPGQKTQIAEILGPNAITSLKAKIKLPEDIEAQRRILRELVFIASWDNRKTPSIWSPLGDFFGTAPGVNYYSSLPLGMTKDCFYSNWYMPFGKKALLELQNDGQQNYTVDFEITYAPLQKPASQYARFHAKWHRNIFLPEEKERAIDWTMLKTKGTGRFCGVQLQIWNPKGGWWGEGDEKFFVDGEKFPSTYGTGSEDYFGYAWSDWHLFYNCYHNQTISELNKGHISVNRWHITDNVPFQKSFEACIEKYYADDRPTLYTCIPYWYQDKDSKDDYPQYPLKDRIDYYTPLLYPMDVAGIVVLEEPQGNLEGQGMGYLKTDKWENGDQLWWTAQKPGRKLRIFIDSPKADEYEIITRLTKAPDYGIVQFHINGQKIGDPIDLYNPETVVATKQLNLGTVPLKKGPNLLIVEMVGTNPDAIKVYMFGMDYLKIKKANKLW